jgi:hypothetical protein
MRTRGNMVALIGGLQREHGLLAANLQATEKIDWRALHKRVVIAEPPKPSPFALRRAKVRAPMQERLDDK